MDKEYEMGSSAQFIGTLPALARPADASVCITANQRRARLALERGQKPSHTPLPSPRTVKTAREKRLLAERRFFENAPLKVQRLVVKELKRGQPPWSQSIFVFLTINTCNKPPTTIPLPHHLQANTLLGKHTTTHPAVARALHEAGVGDLEVIRWAVARKVQEVDGLGAPGQRQE